MDDVADRLDQASDTLTAFSRNIPTLAVPPGAFAALPALTPAGAPPVGSARASLPPAGTARPGVSPVGSVTSDHAGDGLPGLVGRALHDHWAAVLEARSHEASSAAARLGEMARSVRTTRRGYTATDEAVERRFHQEL